MGIINFDLRDYAVGFVNNLKVLSASNLLFLIQCPSMGYIAHWCMKSLMHNLRSTQTLEVVWQ